MCDSDNDDLPELLDAEEFHSSVQTNVPVPSTSRSPPLEPLTDVSDVNNFMYIRTPTGLPGWNFTNSCAPVSFNSDDDFKQTSRCSRSRVRTHRHDTGRNQCCSMRIACAIIKENKILIEEVKSLNESILLLNHRLNDLQTKLEAEAEDAETDEDDEEDADEEDADETNDNKDKDDAEDEAKDEEDASADEAEAEAEDDDANEEETIVVTQSLYTRIKNMFTLSD
jgi:hypothetical protein